MGCAISSHREQSHVPNLTFRGPSCVHAAKAHLFRSTAALLPRFCLSQLRATSRFVFGYKSQCIPYPVSPKTCTVFREKVGLCASFIFENFFSPAGPAAFGSKSIFRWRNLSVIPPFYRTVHKFTGTGYSNIIKQESYLHATNFPGISGCR